MPAMLARPLAILALPLVLMACVVPDAPPVDPLPLEAACGAAELQDLVGQPATRLQTMRFGGPVRIIRPDMAVTMDFVANRLNIYIDAAEMIVAVRCG